MTYDEWIQSPDMNSPFSFPYGFLMPVTGVLNRPGYVQPPSQQSLRHFTASRCSPPGWQAAAYFGMKRMEHAYDNTG